MPVCNFWKGSPNWWVDRSAWGRSESLNTDQICSRATLVDRSDAARYHREILFALMLPHTTAPGVWGNREFSYATHLQPWHSFNSACTPSPSFSTLPHHHEISPPPPHPLFFFQEQISLCSQKCWVLLFALYTEIRWGCKLSPNICSLEWSRRGEARTGWVCMLFSVALSECVMYGFVYVCVHARVGEQLFK